MSTVQGYGVELTLEPTTLTIRATTKAGRISVFGADPRSEVTIPLREIASVKHIQPPKMLLGAVNGSLILRTEDGVRYQLNYRARKHADFGPVAEATEVAVRIARSA